MGEHGEWSEAAKSVWGKFCREDGVSWMPLVQHLADSAAVAVLLWDHWLPVPVKRAIEAGLPSEARDGRTLVAWLAGLHDVAKASPAFAIKVLHLAERMRRHGLDAPTKLPEQNHAPHGAVGQVVVSEWLMDAHGASYRAAMSFADVVGGHHGRPPRATTLDHLSGRPDLVGRGQWHQVRLEILEGMSAATGADRYLSSWVRHPLTPQAQMLVSAVVVLADWLVSDPERFPYVPEPTDAGNRARAAWEDVALPGPWHAVAAAAEDDVERMLAARFPRLAGQETRPVQRVCVELARSAQSPGLLVVEAPMGQGKTEAALLAAETLAARFECGGVFIGLPTMATSDAMFGRVLSWVETTPGQGATSAFLAHGKARLNEEFEGLVRRGAAIASVWDDDRRAAGSRTGADRTGPEAVAVSWLSGRKKGLLANFVVGTIDQALFAGLYARHLVLCHLAMAGKVVVIDEVHAADDYMRLYLCRVLEWLAAYGTPVILLSATLPTDQRRELCEAYGKGLGMTAAALPDLTAYPSVTTVDESGASTVPVPSPDPGRPLEVRALADDPAALAELLTRSLTDGGCVAVIRDTVRRAQETYESLCEQFGRDDVILVHSRFLAPDRAARETTLRGLLGPPGADERPHRLIVVGTQVLEQSLDVDFDLMVSDIAPVDLLLQRAGRLHRHRRGAAARPAPLRFPELHITGITGWDEHGMPAFDRGVTAVYPVARLLRTSAVLGLAPDSTTTLTLPDDIRPLVEAVYAAEPAVPSQWRDATVEADKRLSRLLGEARGRADAFRLRGVPRRGTSLVELFQAETEASEDGAGGSTVRDGADGLEVVVVQRRDGELRAMPGDYPHAGRQLPDLYGAPDWPVAKAVATCTLRLPETMTRPWAVESVIADLEANGFEGWQQSPWLAGQLVLVLDEAFEATVGAFRLRYDPDLGLQVARREPSR